MFYFNQGIQLGNGLVIDMKIITVIILTATVMFPIKYDNNKNGKV